MINELKIYESMYLIRSIEENITKRYSENQMRCPVHLSIGQEACATGLIIKLKKNDKVFSNHRCHAHYLAKGGDPKKMLAEIYGKKNGCVGGVGGSMHLQDLNANLVASIPIVSSAIGLATGSALHQKRSKSKNLTVVFIGDAALEEGIFYECANFASLHKLPIIFACENNLFSVYTNIKERQINDNFKRYSDAFKIPYLRVDGNKVDKVYEASVKTVNYVRKNKGPYFLQMDTYRYFEHCGPGRDDHLNYRNKHLTELWKNKCPIKYLKNKLIKKNIKNKLKIESIEKKLNIKIESYFNFASKSELPHWTEAKKYVYA